MGIDSDKYSLSFCGFRRFGESKYVPYDANEILRRITSWSDLKFLPVREALPLVLESPEFLYETPQKRYD